MREMDIGSLLGGAGILMGATMAGAGALKMFLTSAHAVERVPAALERAATASELVASVAKSSADLATNLLNLREGQEQIRITLSVLTARQDELKDGMQKFKGEVLEALNHRRGNDD